MCSPLTHIPSKMRIPSPGTIPSDMRCPTRKHSHMTSVLVLCVFHVGEIMHITSYLCFFVGQTHFKQLLDEVFVISGIIKVEVSVISQAKGRG